MTALAIIIAVLVLILLIPVGIDAQFISGSAAVSAKLGPARVQLLPRKKKAAGAGPKPARRKKPERKQTAEDERKKPKQRLTRQDIVEIAGLGLKTLSRLRRGLSIDAIMLHITVAAEDPYDAVVRYNRITAALGSLSPPAHRAFRIKREDVGVRMDFTDTKMSADARLAASFRLGQLLRIALCAAAGFLIWLSHRRKRAKSSEKIAAGDACAQKGC